MARPKPEIERVPVIVRFLPEQLARVDAWDGDLHTGVERKLTKGRRARIEQLIELGLAEIERRAARRAKKVPEEEAQE